MRRQIEINLTFHIEEKTFLVDSTSFSLSLSILFPKTTKTIYFLSSGQTKCQRRKSNEYYMSKTGSDWDILSYWVAES